MKKRTRKRHHKRSTRPHTGQVRQKLSRLSQEVTDEDLDDIHELPGKAHPRRSEPPTVASDGSSIRGLVVGLGSGHCLVESEGETFSCVLPSRFAAQQRSAVAVGDRVSFSTHGDAYRLTEIYPRRTALSRPDPQNSRLERVIAANADVVSIVVAVKRPPLRPALIDRYLIACQRGGADALLVVNKVDLLSDKAEEELAVLETYTAMGVPICRCSAKANIGIEDLRQTLTDRTTVFVGHSGVGKSSLVNALDPSLDLATNEVDSRYARGRHTTTQSRLFFLAGNIRLIDTPGIRELGLWQLNARELRFFFPEFEALAEGCRFRDCTHLHEPDCAVQEAVKERRLDEARYATYKRIYRDLGQGS